MVNCTFILNGLPFTSFTYDGVRCTAFSGNGPHRNNPSSGNVPNNGSIPPGRYYIVDRQSGGTLGPILTIFFGWWLLAEPLSAAPGHGEVNGLGDGLWVWFDHRLGTRTIDQLQAAVRVAVAAYPCCE